jgi:hypothetical protein
MPGKRLPDIVMQSSGFMTCQVTDQEICVFLHALREIRTYGITSVRAFATRIVRRRISEWARRPI